MDDPTLGNPVESNTISMTASSRVIGTRFVKKHSSRQFHEARRQKEKCLQKAIAEELNDQQQRQLMRKRNEKDLRDKIENQNQKNQEETLERPTDKSEPQEEVSSARWSCEEDDDEESEGGRESDNTSCSDEDSGLNSMSEDERVQVSIRRQENRLRIAIIVPRPVKPASSVTNFGKRDDGSMMKKIERMNIEEYLRMCIQDIQAEYWAFFKQVSFGE